MYVPQDRYLFFYPLFSLAYSAAVRACVVVGVTAGEVRPPSSGASLCVRVRVYAYVCVCVSPFPLFETVQWQRHHRLCVFVHRRRPSALSFFPPPYAAVCPVCLCPRRLFSRCYSFWSCLTLPSLRAFTSSLMCVFVSACVCVLCFRVDSGVHARAPNLRRCSLLMFSFLFRLASPLVCRMRVRSTFLAASTCAPRLPLSRTV